jgi:hypothetical protein
MFNVVEPNLILRMSAPLIELATEAYLAPSVDRLSIIEINLGQIDSALERYKNTMRNRRLARRWAVGFTILSFVIIGCVVIWGKRFGLNEETNIDILMIPLPVVIWSYIGSLAAMLYRFNKTTDVEMADPLRWMFTRPVMGVVMGVVSFLILKVGLVSVGSTVKPDTIGKEEFVWLFAFIAGFSDRYSDAILQTLVGRFGGDGKAELVSLDGG